ncbi:hypothetical protein RYX36_031830 [Vicia faba]
MALSGFLHLDLLWKDIGRYKHMNQKSFGQSIALIDQMKALLISVGDVSIGTNSTMHDHIKKLLERFYATKDANMRFTPTNLGEALVMGYDDMGYKLWKPYLRAVMERDMKLVSEGNKSKGEVLHTSLQQMRACFTMEFKGFSL